MMIDAAWLDEDITRRNRVILVDRYVNAQTECAALRACDIVWLAYDNHFTMSGVMVQAGQYSKPIVGRDLGLIGWYIRNREIGVTLPKDDLAGAAHAIEKLAINTSALSALGRNARETFAAKPDRLLDVEN